MSKDSLQKDFVLLIPSSKNLPHVTKLKFYKQKDDYEWDKDCVYYLKCKEKGNRLCHVCKEKNDYMGGSL